MNQHSQGLECLHSPSISLCLPATPHSGHGGSWDTPTVCTEWSRPCNQRPNRTHCTSEAQDWHSMVSSTWTWPLAPIPWHVLQKLHVTSVCCHLQQSQASLLVGLFAVFSACTPRVRSGGTLCERVGTHRELEGPQVYLTLCTHNSTYLDHKCITLCIVYHWCQLTN